MTDTTGREQGESATVNVIAAIVGRILLAIIFIVSGANKLIDPAATDAMIVAAGLPAGLAIPTGIFELVGGLSIAFGFMTRLFSILLAGFCLVTILFFHRQFTDPMQAAMAMKNLAIAGGFLCLFAHSQMRSSYDAMAAKHEGFVEARAAEERARDAELRAAKAEGRAEGATTVTPVAAPVVAPVAAPVVDHDRDRDGVDDRVERVRPAPVVDRDRDGVDDRDEGTPIDPRLRP
jgi:putative oxidoreductase